MNEDMICMMIPAKTDYAPGLRLAVSAVMEHMGFLFDDVEYVKNEQSVGYVMMYFHKETYDKSK